MGVSVGDGAGVARESTVLACIGATGPAAGRFGDALPSGVTAIGRGTWTTARSGAGEAVDGPVVRSSGGKGVDGAGVAEATTSLNVATVVTESVAGVGGTVTDAATVTEATPTTGVTTATVATGNGA
jgi:hypothetical protein